MENMTITIHNVETGKITEREMNKQELAAVDESIAFTKAEAVSKATKAAEKAALLAKLGINEDEAKLLLS